MGRMKGVLIWIAQQFFGNILRGVFNNVIMPCFNEMVTCPSGDNDYDEVE